MNFTIQRAALIKPLQMISGVVEKRQTLPILANILVVIKDQQLSLTATDLEIEMISSIPLMEVESDTIAAITVSARKLVDICRALPEDAVLKFTQEGDHFVLRSGKSRFLLTTLPAHDFPSIEEMAFAAQFTINQGRLKKLLAKTSFAMGHQDVRHYLNGALFDVNQGTVKCVATDGHRLAFSSIDVNIGENQAKVILPRKSILELSRLLDQNNEQEVSVCIGENHFRVISPDFTFTSKLISAQYPDYEKLIPRSVANTAVVNREALKQALTRASILSNEKFRGVRLQLSNDLLRIVANNPEQEEAEELVQLEYQGSGMEIGFNVAYLLDVVSTMSSEDINWSFSDPNAGVLIDGEDGYKYVVMPMRL